MKISYLLTGLCFLFISSCTRSKNIGLLQGLWKVESVEVLRNNELNRVIDPCFQYWNFYKTDSIRIFNKKQIQKCLYVKISKGIIKCINPVNGSLVDEFIIDKLNKTHLELTSRR